MLESIKSFFCSGNKFVIYNLVSRNLKLRYRKSILGIFWTVLSPSSLAVVYYIVFKYFVKMQVQNYLIMVLVGVLSWSFFSNSVVSGLESISGNQPIFNKVPLNLNVFNLSEVVTGFVNLILSFPVIGLFSIITGHNFSITILCSIPILGLLFIQSYCLGLMAGMVFVYFRDLRHIISIFIQILFYMTPVIYKYDVVPESFRVVKFLNPVYFLFESLQKTVVFNEWLSLEGAICSLVWTFILFFLTLKVNSKLKYRIVEDL